MELLPTEKLVSALKEAVNPPLEIAASEDASSLSVPDSKVWFPFMSMNTVAVPLFQPLPSMERALPRLSEVSLSFSHR